MRRITKYIAGYLLIIILISAFWVTVENITKEDMGVLEFITVVLLYLVTMLHFSRKPN